MSEWEKAREAAYRALSSAVGYEYDTLYANKREYIDDRGNRHDVNTPYKCDFEDGLDAALSAFETAGYVLVPMKASEAMVLAGTDSGITDPDGWATCAYEIEQLWPLIVTAALKERT